MITGNLEAKEFLPTGQQNRMMQLGRCSTIELPIDWSKIPGIEIDPERQSGAPVFAGTRTPVDVVTNNIHKGGTPAEIAEILDNFDVTPEQVQLVIGQLQRQKPAVLQP